MKIKNVVLMCTALYCASTVKAVEIGNTEYRLNRLEAEIGRLKSDIKIGEFQPVFFNNTHPMIHTSTYFKGKYFAYEVENQTNVWVSSDGIDFFPEELRIRDSSSTNFPENAYVYTVERVSDDLLVAGLEFYGIATSTNGYDFEAVQIDRAQFGLDPEEKTISYRVFVTQSHTYISFCGRQNGGVLIRTKDFKTFDKILDQSVHGVFDCLGNVVVVANNNVFISYDGCKTFIESQTPNLYNYVIHDAASDGYNIVAGLQFNGVFEDGTHFFNKKISYFVDSDKVEDYNGYTSFLNNNEQLYAKVLVSRDGGKTFEFFNIEQEFGKVFSIFSVAYSRGIWCLSSIWDNTLFIGNNLKELKKINFPNLFGCQKMRFLGSDLYMFNTFDSVNWVNKTPNNVCVRLNLESMFANSTKFLSIDEFNAHVVSDSHLTLDQVVKWNQKSDFSGNYYDLNNIPETVAPSDFQQTINSVYKTIGWVCIIIGIIILAFGIFFWKIFVKKQE